MAGLADAPPRWTWMRLCSETTTTGGCPAISGATLMLPVSSAPDWFSCLLSGLEVAEFFCFVSKSKSGWGTFKLFLCNSNIFFCKSFEAGLLPSFHRM